MMELSQPIAVRIASTNVIAAIAFYNALGSKELFIQKGFLRRAKSLI